MYYCVLVVTIECELCLSCINMHLNRNDDRIPKINVCTLRNGTSFEVFHSYAICNGFFLCMQFSALISLQDSLHGRPYKDSLEGDLHAWPYKDSLKGISMKIICMIPYMIPWMIPYTIPFVLGSALPNGACFKITTYAPYTMAHPFKMTYKKKSRDCTILIYKYWCISQHFHQSIYLVYNILSTCPLCHQHILKSIKKMYLLTMGDEHRGTIDNIAMFVSYYLLIL